MDGVLHVNGFECRLLVEQDPASPRWIASIQFSRFVLGEPRPLLHLPVPGVFATSDAALAAAATLARSRALSGEL